MDETHKSGRPRRLLSRWVENHDRTIQRLGAFSSIGGLLAFLVVAMASFKWNLWLLDDLLSYALPLWVMVLLVVATWPTRALLRRLWPGTRNSPGSSRRDGPPHVYVEGINWVRKPQTSYASTNYPRPECVEHRGQEIIGPNVNGALKSIVIDQVVVGGIRPWGPICPGDDDGTHPIDIAESEFNQAAHIAKSRIDTIVRERLRPAPGNTE